MRTGRPAGPGFIAAELLDRLRVLVRHLPLLGEFEGTMRQRGGLVRVSHIGPECGQGNDDGTAYADRGGCHGGVHAGSVRGYRSVSVTGTQDVRSCTAAGTACGVNAVSLYTSKRLRPLTCPPCK